VFFGIKVCNYKNLNVVLLDFEPIAQHYVGIFVQKSNRVTLCGAIFLE